MKNKYTFKSKDMQIEFFSLVEAEQIQPRSDSALISLLDPDVDNAIDYDKWENKIISRFEDVEEKEAGRKVFTRKKAKEIIDFTTNLSPDIRYLVIHCYAGISRSGAVTKFITKYIFSDCYNKDFDKEYNCYNDFVYQTLETVWLEDYCSNSKSIKRS